MSMSHSSIHTLSKRIRILTTATLSTLALGFGLAASGTALAQESSAAAPPANMPHYGHPAGHGHNRHGKDRMMRRMLDAVHATPEQRERIHAIQKNTWENSRPLMQQRQELMQQRMQLLAATTIDPGALESLRGKQMAISDQLSRQMTQTQYEIAQVLTPEQRQQIYALMQKRMHHRMEHDGRGAMQRDMANP